MNDYQKQALVWDWDGFDDTPEHEYWCDFAQIYGKNVLIPMCAHGKLGAFMAGRGFDVVAFDITPEMIREGKKRYGTIDGLSLVTADLFRLDLSDKAFDFTFLAGNGDFHLLQTTDEVEMSFRSLYRHLRDGGCMALELSLPPTESYSYPKSVFHPRKPNYTDKKVWKENQCSYDAAKKRQHIEQTVYIEDKNGMDSFIQSVCLQYYDRDVVLALLRQCGFTIEHEYRDRAGTPWKPGEDSLLIEAVRH